MRVPALVLPSSFAACVAFALPLPHAAAAAPADVSPTAGTATQDPASAGTTELEGQGQFAAAADKPEEDTDITEFDISLGGLFSTGNARSLAVTGTSNFLLRRKIHQFGAAFAGNYARAAVDADSDPENTVGNVQGRLRYDVFVHERVSLFGMATARHDPFQGLQLRLNIDPGVAVYVINEPVHRLWGEVGYDFQYDVREEDAILLRDDNDMVVLDGNGNPVRALDRTRITHAARLFGGYTNNINERVTFKTGLEYLQSVTSARRWRINWDVGLTTQLVGSLSFAATFTTRVDHDPLPDIKRVDTITAVSLVYRFL